MIYANQPDLRSWVSVPAGSDFPIQNLPFGIFQYRGQSPGVGVAIGEHVVDVGWLHDRGHLDGLDIPVSAVKNRFLNDLIALGKQRTRALRDRLARILETDDPFAAQREAAQFLYPQQEVNMLLPVQIGDYTDFYSSREHATNVGTMFRDPDNALLPNWLHLPVGYHGRASSIVVSGTPIRRPNGQTRPDDTAPPVYGPSRLLDFELEMAFIVGQSTTLGEQVAVGKAEEAIFGLVLFNDWSARDIQKWEYVPLGPFLGKSFASTMSPWIVTLDALEPFRVESPAQDPEVLPYLKCSGKKSFDIHLEASLTPAGGVATAICQTNFRHMYWTIAQQLAHHTVNGCNLRVGDMMASGTISGPTPESYGSMLELSWRGTRPIVLSDGSERKFLQDGDTLTLTGHCKKGNVRIGFGEATGKILPAR
jgi:fumarylacetoacetase